MEILKLDQHRFNVCKYLTRLTFLLTDRIKSAAVNVGGGGVLVCCWAFVVDCPPWGEGNCEVEAISPTATQVEHDLENYLKCNQTLVLICV